MQYRTLKNGVRMPMLGFGVYQIPPEDTQRTVLAALETGYRLIDTAQAYQNEEAVGRAVKESGLPREDVFITTKLWIQDFSFEGALHAAELSLKRLGTDYIDLMLLHQPMGDFYSAWRALEKLYREGKLRAIGMANCYPHVVADICETVDVLPMVNQVELHPFFQQELNLKTMADYGVQPEAWGPFDEGRRGFFKNETLVSVGKKYGKTSAQAALRWNIDRGVIVIPKSVHPERMRENFDIFDFKLDASDMAEIAKLDLGRSEIVDHFDPAFVRALHRHHV